MPQNRRSGFTLTELLIVIGILLILSTMSLAVYNTGRSSDRMRSGARTAQSALLGAKDRAMHAKNFRGVRLFRDENALVAGPFFTPGGISNGIPCLISGFIYLQPVDMQTYPAGSIQLERPDVDQNGSADSSAVFIIRGFDASSPNTPAKALYVNFAQLANTGTNIFPSPGQIRIPATTGQWYQFSYQTSGAAPYNLSIGNEVLQLTSAFTQPPLVPFIGNTPPNNLDVAAFPISSSTNNFSSCDIQMGNEALPFHSPISLPSSCVIDLRYSSSNLQNAAGANFAAGSRAPNVDIMFSPRGNVAGVAGGTGALYFTLRDIVDASGASSVFVTTPPSPRDPSDPTCQGECLILALNPATGLVQTYPANLTDVLNNATGASGSDGLADNLFSFAQTGKAAGR